MRASPAIGSRHPRLDNLEQYLVRFPQISRGNTINHDAQAFPYWSGGELMKRTERYVLGMVLILAFSASLWAQGTAQISGSVTDPSGARLPGVEVTATQTAT